MTRPRERKASTGLEGAGKARLAIVSALLVDRVLREGLAGLEAEPDRKSLEQLVPEIGLALRWSLEDQAGALDALRAARPDARIYINVVCRLAGGGAGAELVSAELSQTPIQVDSRLETVESCFGSTTTYRRLALSEEIRVGDLHGE
jgi:hypothetical protein